MSSFPITTAHKLRYFCTRLSLLLACSAIALLVAASGASSLLAQSEPTRVTSDAVDCLVVSGEATSEATLSLAWGGEATDARLMLSLSGAEAAHAITLNGRVLAQLPLESEPTDASVASGDPCAAGEAFYFDVPLEMLVNGDNRLALRSDALPGDQWAAINVRLEVRGPIVDESVRAAASAAVPSTVTFVNDYDNTTQETRVQAPSGYVAGTPTPLILVVHPRSTDMFWGEDLGVSAAADARGWLYASPQLHGSWPGDGSTAPPNPPGKYAYASLEAQHDVIGMLRYMMQHYNVDTQRIYLYGASMGAQGALVIGAKYPDVFAAVFENKGPSDWPAWYDQTVQLHSDGYNQAFHYNWMKRECYQTINGTPTRRDPSQNPFCYQRRSGIQYASNLRYTPLKITHSAADLLVPASHSYNMRDAVQTQGHAAPLSFEIDTVVGPNCNDGNSSMPSPVYHCFENEPNDVLNFLAPFTLNNNPDFVNLHTDESKAFYWLDIEQLGGERMSQVQVSVDRAHKSLAVEVNDAQPLRLGFNLGSTPITGVIPQPGLGFPNATYLIKPQNQPASLADYSTGYLNVTPATGQSSFTLSALALGLSANPAIKPSGQPLVSTISVAAVDGLGNPVPNGTPLTLTTSAGQWQNGSPTLAATVNNGTLSATLTLGAADNQAQVQALLGNSSGTLTISANGTPNTPTPTATSTSVAPTSTPTHTPQPSATPAPTATPTSTPTSTPGGGVLLVQEAEAGTIYGKKPIEIGSDPAASGGAYIHWPDGTGNRTGSAGDWRRIEYTFDVPTAGDYRVVGWTFAAKEGDDSFWVRVDGAPVDGYLWDIPIGGGYQQNYVIDRGDDAAVRIALAAGLHTVNVYLREDGARLDKIALEAAGGSATPMPSATPSPTSPPAGTPAATSTPGGSALLMQEAETGSIYGKKPIETGSDPAASGGAYIHWPDGTGNRTGSAGDWRRIEYTFDVPTAGNYRVVGWTFAQKDGDDSFWVRVDGAPADGYLWDIPIGGGYQQNYVIDRGSSTPAEVTLAAGLHTVNVYLREDGARLDKIALEAATVAAASVSVDAARSTTIEGVVVVDEPTGVRSLPRFPAGVEVTLVDAATQGAAFQATARTDAEGRYYFDGVPAGEYVVTLIPPAGYRADEATAVVAVGVRGTATAHFDLHPAQLLPMRMYLPLVGR